MENKLQQLKEIIWESNPEIMELKFGCEFYFTNEHDKKPILATVIEDSNYYFCNDYPETTAELYCGCCNWKLGKILGRPITHADCLIALRGLNTTPGKIGRSWTFINKKITTLLELWNLKYSLNEQSKECQEFLLDSLK